MVDTKFAFWYNYWVMKKQSFIIDFKPRTRAHWVLFDNDLPFKPKVVPPKTRYKRREKHQKPYAEK